jgi:vacuolar-type H+-ATPase subunit I/STV1
MTDPTHKTTLVDPTSETNVADLTKKASAFGTAANAGTSLLHEVVDVVRICADCVKTIEAEQTERTRIDRKARLQIELIRERRELMVKFLDEAFAERRQNFRDLFQRLDLALERDSLEETTAVLGAIVDLAKSSPFEALRDAATAHAVLLDKSVTWEL